MSTDAAGGRLLLFVIPGKAERHLNEVSYEGRLELLDETGAARLGRQVLRNLCEAWAQRHERGPSDYSGQVLSLYAFGGRYGLDNLLRAGRNFAANEFSKHRYVIAAHAESKGTHLHVVVRAQDREGRILRPGRGDLERWQLRLNEALERTQAQRAHVYGSVSPER